MNALLLAAVLALPSWSLTVKNKGTGKVVVYAVDNTKVLKPGDLPGYRLPELGAACKFATAPDRVKAILSCETWIVSLECPARGVVVMTAAGHELTTSCKP